ncbi:MAG: hypothetical protein H7201_15235 [Candidatus Saccharibacteria bacterium]|nr:hypothetical protein [Microbacteriaceae bacterium]
MAVGLVVFVDISSPAASIILRSRLVRCFGTISFSPYLMHIPVIATFAFVVGDTYRPVTAVAGFPLAIAAANEFPRHVERPSHRLSYRLRCWAAEAHLLSCAVRRKERP